jgi:4-amino-4-deoxy-L-arabinose transferase-like glycosyltransferase
MVALSEGMKRLDESAHDTAMRSRGQLMTTVGTKRRKQDFVSSVQVVRLAVIAVFFLGYGVRILGLEGPSIWIDEVLTTERARQTFAEMVSGLPQDQVPFYYASLQSWADVLGSSLFLLRLFSVLMGVLTIPLMYQFGKTLYDARTGLLAALFLAISPYLVFYSRMARPYPLAWVLGLLSCVCFLIFSKTGRKRCLLVFVLASLGAIYTHLTALAIIAVLIAFSMLRWKRTNQLAVHWMTTLSLIALGLAPLFFSFLGSGTLTAQAPKFDSLTPWGMANIFMAWNLGNSVSTNVVNFAGTILVFGLLGANAIIHVGKESAVAPNSNSTRIPLTRLSVGLHVSDVELLPLGLILAPIVLGMLATYVVGFKLNARVMSIASLSWYLLLARGILQIKHPILMRALMGVIGFLLICSLLVAREMNAGVDWRWVANHIELAGKADEAIVVSPSNYGKALTEYYAGHSALVPMQEEPSVTITAAKVDLLLSEVVHNTGIWLITINDSVFDQDGLLGTRLMGKCDFLEEIELIPRHARLRHFGQCDW